MLKRGFGGIINVASTAAFVPVPYSAVYSASKAYVLSLSEALHGEYGPKGIQVTTLCPGGTESNFSQVAQAVGSDQSATSSEAPSVAMDSPEFVAEIGINTFLKGKCTVVSGKKNYVTPLMARVLPRKTVIQTIGSMFKAFVKE